MGTITTESVLSGNNNRVLPGVGIAREEWIAVDGSKIVFCLAEQGWRLQLKGAASFFLLRNSHYPFNRQQQVLTYACMLTYSVGSSTVLHTYTVHT